MKISPAEVAEEKQRVAHGNYRQFVRRVTLRGVRGFADQTVEYRYPVTGLIGTNGGGKSTILGATALAYRNVRPGIYFPKASVGDNSMTDWAIEFELIDKPINANHNIVRTARFAQAKWRRDDFPERSFQYIEIQRTVPAGEIARFRRFLGPQSRGIVEEELPQDTIRYASAVLDKNVENYRLFRLENAPEHQIYVGQEGDLGYSQFHFGAGEASVIATIDRIEKSEANSLILIEEVENGLHPVAVRLFVNYLENVARRKRLQIVFTTHSQMAIDELPDVAVWAAINKRTWNGRLTIDGLRAITGEVPDMRVVFVEDRFVKEWIENALGRFGEETRDGTRVFEAGGYPNLLTVCQYHNDNPLIEVPSVALVDGDQYDPEADQELPEFAKFVGGGIPENTVFDYIYNNRYDLSGIIQQRCLLTRFDQDRIVREIEAVRNSACDPHIIFQKLSQKLEFSSELRVRDGMIDIFNENNREFWGEILDFVRDRGH